MTSPKPKRRWYQFSLRTLIAVTLLSCVVFGGWLQFMRNRAAENRERVAAVEKAVAEFDKLGGRVHSEYEVLRNATWLEKLFDDPGGPDDPVEVLDVRFVDLRGTSVTDAGLEHLKGLTRLETLLLYDTKVTDAGLKHLNGLTNLEHLDLTACNVTDAGLEHVKGLMNLEYVDLRSTIITDTGLKHLRGLTSLKTLLLFDTEVTAEGVKKLKQTLPDSKILH